MLRTGAPPTAHAHRRRTKPSPKKQKPTAEEKAKQHEISEFLDDLRELGIGEAHPVRERTQTPVDSRPLEPSAEVQVPSAVQRMAEEWTPLNLSYGIPLFSERANQAICDKVGGYLVHGGCPLLLSLSSRFLLPLLPSLPPPLFLLPLLSSSLLLPFLSSPLPSSSLSSPLLFPSFYLLPSFSSLSSPLLFPPPLLPPSQLQECALFKVESLQRQTESNRLLTLDLLSFINEHQVCMNHNTL